MEKIELNKRLDIYALENDFIYYFDDDMRKREIRRIQHMAQDEQEDYINDMIEMGYIKQSLDT